MHFNKLSHNSHFRRGRRLLRSRGVTLLEVLVCIMILGAMIVPALTLLGSVAASYSRQANRDIARCLAQELMSEIKKCEFEDPDDSMRTIGPETDEIEYYYSYTRVDFDDVDDFALINETPPVFPNGELMLEFEPFTRVVEVVYVDPANTSSVSIAPTNLLRIRVTVSHPAIPDYVVETFRSRSGPGSLEFGAQADYVRHVSLNLKLNGQSQTIRSGAEIRNEVPLAN